MDILKRDLIVLWVVGAAFFSASSSQAGSCEILFGFDYVNARLNAMERHPDLISQAISEGFDPALLKRSVVIEARASESAEPFLIVIDRQQDAVFYIGRNLSRTAREIDGGPQSWGPWATISHLRRIDLQDGQVMLFVPGEAGQKEIWVGSKKEAAVIISAKNQAEIKEILSRSGRAESDQKLVARMRLEELTKKMREDQNFFESAEFQKNPVYRPFEGMIRELVSNDVLSVESLKGGDVYLAKREIGFGFSRGSEIILIVEGYETTHLFYRPFEGQATSHKNMAYDRVSTGVFRSGRAEIEGMSIPAGSYQVILPGHSRQGERFEVFQRPESETEPFGFRPRQAS